MQGAFMRHGCQLYGKMLRSASNWIAMEALHGGTTGCFPSWLVSFLAGLNLPGRNVDFQRTVQMLQKLEQSLLTFDCCQKFENQSFKICQLQLQKNVINMMLHHHECLTACHVSAKSCHH